MATNGGKRYFHIDENASSKEIYALLDDVESADEDGIDNLINDSDTAFTCKLATCVLSCVLAACVISSSAVQLKKKLRKQLVHRTVHKWLVYM